MASPVSVESFDTHVLITMDDGKANALSFAMLEGLGGALDSAAQQGKTVVIAGRPGRFSAGFDLSVMAKMDDSTLKLLRGGADLSQRLLDFETPVVLGVTGHALAMGALLCLSADYRIGVQGEFKIGLNEVAIGMTLPWFGIELARERLTKPDFGKSVGLAHLYTPDSAVSAGFLDEAVQGEDLAGRLEAVAATFSALDMGAHRESKRRVRNGLFERFDEALKRDFEGGQLFTASN